MTYTCGMLVLTIGHSTRTAAEFLDLLAAHTVNGIADVRRFPMSRRHPHFSREALAAFLAEHRIDYRHFEELGGRRRPTAASPNGAWRHASFRAYADYMATDAFEKGIESLLALAPTHRLVIMCAEAQWWRCHRQLIADALVVRGVDVRHIMSRNDAAPHRLTPFARVDGESVSYPGLI
jgi:uncharacterized protein (DUF488 family)